VALPESRQFCWQCANLTRVFVSQHTPKRWRDINIESEADIQDVLYLLLRPWIIALPTSRPLIRQQNRFVIKDFVLHQADL